MEKPFYQLSNQESLSKLESSKKGLSNTESASRQKVYGQNKLSVINRKNPFSLYISQFKDLMIILLIISSLIAFYLNDLRTAIILLVIVFLNSLIGFIQEFKAEKILESLKAIIHPQAKVFRAGKLLETNSEDLVPGDLVFVEAGDAVPADLRIIEEMNLSTNDFALTGESNPTRKFSHQINGEVELSERNNLIFMGTTVATGHAYGLVIGTGMNTELGKIANLSQSTRQEMSPLQIELNNLAKKLTFGTILLSLLLASIALKENFSFKEAFIFAIGIAASMVPQGLPAQVSVALSLSAGRLAKQKAIIKKLSSVETLGSTSIICTDKTGTLTKNEMTVQNLLCNQKIYKVTGNGYEPAGKFILNKKDLDQDQLKSLEFFLLTGYFASNARISPPDSHHPNWYCIGDPTEGAMISLAAKAGLDLAELDETSPELSEFSFDSVRKRMSSIRDLNGKNYLFVKGSPLSILEKCTHIQIDQKIRPITSKDIDFIKKYDDQWAFNAMRNLGFAYKPLDHNWKKISMENAESKLIFLGLVSMIDPPRIEVAAAMAAAHLAQIKVIIITGDYALTAYAIAQKIGLANPKQIQLIDGKKLRQLSDHQLSKILEADHLIFARTSPEDKLRIVELLKKKGEIIAVTGDGINDAPALKSAHIGVAMGKTGTEVAKESAEIILTDDSFSTLVNAIQEGRIIFQNLRKTILSCITSNGGELFTVLISLAMGAIFQIPIAITAVQILAIDLIAEMLPLTALTWDPPLSSLMEEKPRNTKAHLLDFKNILDLIFSGFLMGALAYGNYFLLISGSNWEIASLTTDSSNYMRATALTYITIVFCQFANILSRRAGKNSVFSKYIYSNKKLLLAFATSIFLICNIIYNPTIAYYFGTAPLITNDWIMGIVAGFLYLIIREGSKKFSLAKPVR